MGEMEHKYSDVGELISVTTDSHGFVNSTIGMRELKEHAKCSSRRCNLVFSLKN